ncbi:unnamed protein product, partial [Thlaspi arvense]
MGQVVDVKDIETVQITNAFETSKLMMNPALPEVAEFMNALPDDGLALTIVETPNDDKMVKKKEYWSNLQQKTIEELLITSEMVDTENIPQANKNLIRKTFQFCVCVEKENLYYSLETYKVGNVYSGDEIITFADSSLDQLTQVDNLSTIISANEVFLHIFII